MATLIAIWRAVTTAWGVVSSPAGRVGAAVLIAVAALGFAYQKGEEHAAAQCDAAALRVQIETLQRDLDIAEKAQIRAEQQAKDQEARAADLDERLTSYEADLGSALPACLLSGSDVERLRDLTK